MLAAQNLITDEEYLEADAASDVRLELIGGEIVAMAAAEPIHALIAANVLTALPNRLTGQPCLVFDSSIRVRLGDAGAYAYPDATVACPPRIFLATKPATLATPTVVFEVLSPSTEVYDRGDKFADYRTSDTLKSYVLVSTRAQRVEHFSRLGPHDWHMTDIIGEGGLLLAVLGVEIPLAEIFEGVEALHEDLAERPVSDH